MHHQIIKNVTIPTHEPQDQYEHRMQLKRSHKLKKKLEAFMDPGQSDTNGQTKGFVSLYKPDYLIIHSPQIYLKITKE